MINHSHKANPYRDTLRLTSGEASPDDGVSRMPRPRKCPVAPGYAGHYSRERDAGRLRPLLQRTENLTNDQSATLRKLRHRGGDL